jgi:ADP-heptose:LPS heptosyltransferase
MKLLILRFSAIGDIVLTTPVVRCLREQLGAEIHYLTKKANEHIVASNPNIQKVFIFEDDIADILPALKQEKYDFVIDLHNNLRSTYLKFRLGVPSYTFQKGNIYKWLLIHFNINILPNTHIVDKYMKAVAPLGVRNDGKGLEYFIPEKDVVNINNILGTKMPFIAFVIGATHFTKRLPSEKIAEICRTMSLPIVLLGGKTEIDAAEKIMQLIDNKAFNYCGKLNLNQSASVVQQAEKVITHDTGLMHIAAAFQKNIISVWGGTIPEFGFYPYYAEGIERNINVEVKNLPCRPCSKHGRKDCPKGHFKCMKEISDW